MKNLRKFLTEIEIIDSIIGLVGVLIIIGSALVVQFFYQEEPCPLCLLQRVAFLNIGIALLLNLRYGNRVSHWAMVVLSSVAGAAVSIRQILLHITDPQGFGSPIFGLHLYTWSFLGFVLAIVGGTLMLVIYPEVPANDNNQ